MAQLEAAAGGEAVVRDSSPANDPIEAIVDEMLPEEEQEESPAEEGEDPDFAADGEEGSEPDGKEPPAIDAPHSLTAEEKALFKTLPREAQEFTARRIGELEKGFQTKAQEAAHARHSARAEALAELQQISQLHAHQLSYTLPHVPERPSYQLQIDDPIEFAERMDAHESALAQYQEVQQAIHHANAQAQQAEQEVKLYEAQHFQAVLSQQFPEFLSDAKLREDLGSIAIELGYPPEQLSNVDARDVLAMRKAFEWKAKADRLDALNKAKMENVRAARNLPPVARPGAARSPAQAGATRKQASWERVKASGGKDHAAFADFLGL